MAIFKVTFRNALNSEGEPFELPADKLNANGVIIDSYGYVEREIGKGDNFSRDLWEFEISDKDADRFVEGLKLTPNVIEYTKE
jgi:hypothetical protein